MDMNRPAAGEGGPHLLFNQGFTMGMQGVFHAYCDEDCTDGSNWTLEVTALMAYGDWVTPVKVDSEGSAHFAVVEYGEGQTTYARYGLTYEDEYALAVAQTPSARPRIILIDGDGRARYGACTMECDQPGNWWFENVGSLALSLGGFGSEPPFDMALDASERPVMAYIEGGSLHVALPGESTVWAAASTLRQASGLPSDVLNYLLILALPLCVLLLWKRRRSGI